MAIEGLEWFQIHLENIDNEKEFEEAMEMAHVKGFEDGYESGEEEGYNSGIYSSVVDEKLETAVKQERERIVELLDKHLGNMDWEDLIKLIKEEQND
jgi:flagellar biosynthesis/type III secretory pathway protein FliH